MNTLQVFNLVMLNVTIEIYYSIRDLLKGFEV